MIAVSLHELNSITLMMAILGRSMRGKTRSVGGNCHPYHQALNDRRTRSKVSINYEPMHAAKKLFAETFSCWFMLKLLLA
jgi:hypothetical protein